MVESSEESLASGDRFFSIIQIGGEVDLSHLSRTHWNHCAPASNRYNYFPSPQETAVLRWGGRAVVGVVVVVVGEDGNRRGERLKKRIFCLFLSAKQFLRMTQILCLRNPVRARALSNPEKIW